jgi:hypothetical protein
MQNRIAPNEMAVAEDIRLFAQEMVGKKADYSSVTYFTHNHPPFCLKS